jgi:proteasome accessory factor B
MSQRDRTERLLNLLFALMASARPVPKHVLRDAIDAYRESPSEDAFERMFERDKDELRSMGVPILTVEGADGVGGIEGYRVAADDYALPEVAFTADELAVLGLAARVWERASLGPAAERALLKLEALGGGGAVLEGPVGIETRIATAEPSFPLLLDAVRTRTAVRFDYRKPGTDAAEAREVQPWGVASRRGHWYLVGFDTGREAPRVFRLSRVVGPVLRTGTPGRYDVPAGIDMASMIAASAPVPEALTAHVRVAPDRAHGLRRRASTVIADPGGDVLELAYSDDEVLASEIVGLGASALVLEPDSLRDAVIRRLHDAASVREA